MTANLKSLCINKPRIKRGPRKGQFIKKYSLIKWKMLKNHCHNLNNHIVIFFVFIRMSCVVAMHRSTF